jgi:hypothetical protein
MAGLRIGTPLEQRGVIQTESRNYHAATVLTMQYLAFSTWFATRGKSNRRPNQLRDTTNTS